ncbi:hypothetical protein [Aneurinibacillus sp. REN35]|uniref:hypothetical protein n=1 Tax=Aneurinibacillus sp. REN35 TaxID=3237286 RepID=UPI0035296DB1
MKRKNGGSWEVDAPGEAATHWINYVYNKDKRSIYLLSGESKEYWLVYGKDIEDALIKTLPSDYMERSAVMKTQYIDKHNARVPIVIKVPEKEEYPEVGAVSKPGFLVPVKLEKGRWIIDLVSWIKQLKL